MNIVRACFALSCLFALSACTSTPSQPKTEKPAEAPAVAPTPAPAEPVPVPPPVPVVATPPPVPAPTPPPAPQPAVAAPAAQAPAPDTVFKAVRSGSSVQLSWTLKPVEEGYRYIEVMRNNTSEAKNRGRIRSVRATLTGIEDTVPETGDRYWYWLKLTTNSSIVINVGPVEAVEAK